MSASGPPRFERKGHQPPTQPGSAAGPGNERGSTADLLARTGANPLLVGLSSGLLGGAAGVSLTWIIASQMRFDTRLVVLAVVVPACLGALLSGWFDLSAKAWERGIRRSLTGALVGGAAGAIGFALADTTFGAMKNTSTDFAMVLGWIIVGALIGAGIAAYGSVDKVLVGLAGGASGGVMGGLLLLILDVDRRAGYPQTLVAVTLAAVAVGLSIGGFERATRHQWLEVLDGPLAGREFPLDGSSVIGSSAYSQISMGIDPQIEEHHAKVTVTESGVSIEPIQGSVRLDGVEIASRTPLTHERIAVGSSYLMLRP